MTQIKLKRAYDRESDDDGYRVYIDRLWPHGLSHQTFHYDSWDKDIAPSNELRRWFHENMDANWPEFVKRYTNELKSNPKWDEFVKSIVGKPVVTLLYSSRNETENNAVVVASLLNSILRTRSKAD